LGVRRIFTRSPPNLAKTFCVTFANKFSPINNNFWRDLQKKIHVFLCKRWAQFLPGLLEILTGFQQIKTLEVRFHLLHPRLPHHCPGKSTFGPCLEKFLPAPMFRGTCSSTEMLKGYLARESLRTPGVTQR